MGPLHALTQMQTALPPDAIDLLQTMEEVEERKAASEQQDQIEERKAGIGEEKENVARRDDEEEEAAESFAVPFAAAARIPSLPVSSVSALKQRTSSRVIKRDSSGSTEATNESKSDDSESARASLLLRTVSTFLHQQRKRDKDDADAALTPIVNPSSPALTRSATTVHSSAALPPPGPKPAASLSLSGRSKSGGVGVMTVKEETLSDMEGASDVSRAASVKQPSPAPSTTQPARQSSSIGTSTSSAAVTTTSPSLAVPATVPEATTPPSSQPQPSDCEEKKQATKEVIEIDDDEIEPDAEAVARAVRAYLGEDESQTAPSSQEKKEGTPIKTESSQPLSSRTSSQQQHHTSSQFPASLPQSIFDMDEDVPGLASAASLILTQSQLALEMEAPPRAQRQAYDLAHTFMSEVVNAPSSRTSSSSGSKAQGVSHDTPMHMPQPSISNTSMNDINMMYSTSGQMSRAGSMAGALGFLPSRAPSANYPYAFGPVQTGSIGGVPFSSHSPSTSMSGLPPAPTRTPSTAVRPLQRLRSSVQPFAAFESRQPSMTVGLTSFTTPPPFLSQANVSNLQQNLGAASLLATYRTDVDAHAQRLAQRAGSTAGHIPRLPSFGSWDSVAAAASSQLPPSSSSPLRMSMSFSGSQQADEYGTPHAMPLTSPSTSITGGMTMMNPNISPIGGGSFPPSSSNSTSGLMSQELFGLPSSHGPGPGPGPGGRPMRTSSQHEASQGSSAVMGSGSQTADDLGMEAPKIGSSLFQHSGSDAAAMPFGPSSHGSTSGLLPDFNGASFPAASSPRLVIGTSPPPPTGPSPGPGHLALTPSPVNIALAGASGQVAPSTDRISTSAPAPSVSPPLLIHMDRPSLPRRNSHSLSKLTDLLQVVSKALRDPLASLIQRLQVDEESARLAAQICSAAQARGLCSLRQSISLSAGALYLALLLEGRRPVQVDFCSKVGVTEVTLRKVTKELISHVWELVPVDYEPVLSPLPTNFPTRPQIDPIQAARAKAVAELPMRSASSSIHAIHGDWRRPSVLARDRERMMSRAVAAAAAATAATTGSAALPPFARPPSFLRRPSAASTRRTILPPGYVRVSVPTSMSGSAMHFHAPTARNTDGQAIHVQVKQKRQWRGEEEKEAMTSQNESGINDITMTDSGPSPSSSLHLTLHPRPSRDHIMTQEMLTSSSS